LIAPLIHPLATTGIIIIFVVFILLQRQDLRNRLVRIAGSHDLQRTTLAMDDAGRRLSRLFLMQLALNAAFGLIIGIGLWAIGVPSAPLWGLLAMVLRFVPYIGAIVAAIFPLIVATAVDPGWSMMLMTAALFLIVEPLIGQRDRAHGLRSQQRTFACSSRCIRDLLDMAVGTNWTDPRDAIDDVSGRAWPPCRAS
jgi:predicted PurR-regulated permease PerM